MITLVEIYRHVGERFRADIAKKDISSAKYASHAVHLYYVLHRVSKKVVHQAHIDNLVNSQRIFKIILLAHSAENLL